MTRTTKFYLKVAATYALVTASTLAVSMCALSFALAEEQPQTADQRIAMAFEHVQAAPPARAGCLPRAEMRMAMAAKYGEEVVIYGQTQAGIMEFYASRANRTWTAVATTPDGISCMVQGGTGWTGPLPTPEPVTGTDMYRILPGKAWPV
jgi:hypothetical protein